MWWGLLGELDRCGALCGWRGLEGRVLGRSIGSRGGVRADADCGGEICRGEG